MTRGSAAATCMCSMMKGIQALVLVWLASLVMLQCHAFVVPTLPVSGKGFGAVATPNGASSPPCAGRARMEMKSCDRAGFIREGDAGPLLVLRLVVLSRVALVYVLTAVESCIASVWHRCIIKSRENSSLPSQLSRR